MRRLLQRVTHYLWLPENCSPELREWLESNGEQWYAVVAEEWWPLFPGVVDRHIVLAEEWRGILEPDLELLECGHEQPIRKWSGKKVKYYNRRRRCDACMIESGGPLL